MADQRVSDMADSGIPDDADLLYLVDVDSAAPKQRQLTIANLREVVNVTENYFVTNVTNITTDGTETELFVDGVGIRLTIPTNTAWAFDALIVAHRQGASGESAGYRIEGVIDRNGGTVSFVGIPTVWTLGEDTPAWTPAATADNVNKALVFTVTGEAGKNIKWAGMARIVKVSH